MGVPDTDPLSQLSLPPGFRFFPTDEELLVQYLCRKVAGHQFSLQIIGEIDLYKFDPWVLPSKASHTIQLDSFHKIGPNIYICIEWICTHKIDFFFFQVKLYLVKKNGTFSVRGTGSTQTVPDPTGLLALVTGRQPVPIKLSPPKVEKSASRKRWCFISEKLQKEQRLIGSCTNIA